MFFDKIFRVLGTLIIGVWVARYLGPERFGLLNYAIAFVAFFAFLPDLGLGQIIVRELKKNKDRQGALLGTAFWLKLIGGLLALLLISTIVFIAKPSDVRGGFIILVIAGGLLFQSLDVVDYFFQSRVLSKYVVISRDCAFLLTSLFKIFLILSQFSVIWFAAAGALDLMLAAFFLALTYRRRGFVLGDWRFERGLAVQLLKYSWPLMLSGFLISIHMRVDQVMLGHMLGNNAVGIYSVAVKLSEFWYFMPTLIVSSLMPYFIGLRETNVKLYNHQLNRLYSLMFWMGIAVGFIALAGGQFIIDLAFGTAYAESYQALIYNIWAGVFVAQAVTRGIWLISENLQKYRLVNNLLAVLVNITGNIRLVPRYGIAGAAISTLVTQFLGTWVFGMLWKPLRHSTLNLMKSANPMLILQRSNTTA